MLATIHFPDPNPIGPGSLWPVVIVACYAVVLWATRLRPLAFAAPPLFIFAASWGDAFPFAGRAFPDADDIVGYYVLSLAAQCFALHVARMGTQEALAYGGVFLFLPGWLLTLEAISRAAYVFLRVDELTTWQVATATALWLAIFTLLMTRAAQPYLRARRSARGLCARCGYDIRRSPDRCPECGEPAPAAARVSPVAHVA